MADSPPLRPLGPMEQLFVMLDQAATIHFSMWARLQGRLTTDLVSAALAALQSRHPLLRAAIEAKGTGALWFVATARPIPLTVVAASSPAKGLVPHLEAEQRHPFNTAAGPLIRARLVQAGPEDQTLLLTFHHAIADGISAATLFGHLFETLDRLQTGQNPDTTPMADDGPLEHHIPSTHRGLHAMARAAAHAGMQNLQRLIRPPTHLPITTRQPPEAGRNRFILNTLTTDQTRRLIHQAQRHGCTVQAALCAAQSHALLSLWPDRAKLHTWLLSLVDLRRRTSPPLAAKIAGLNISMVEACHRVRRDTPFWELARQIQTALQNNINTGFHWWYLPTQARWGGWTRPLRPTGPNAARALVGHARRIRPSALTVTNIGQPAIHPIRPNYRIRAMSFVAPLSFVGRMGAAINTFDGRLHWNFIYNAPAVSPEAAAEFVDRSKAMLIVSI
ncbi:condensation domain-containing protein [Desulfatitalea alkaliphila]|uniref:Condensation domain-containing protein n=1 Tax=Desulfatitalea alkaliphila TaxID=2929485 RepID=A0AA41UPW0_9BACT|nr:condensation domain-containing protein [Desulfatitalea alkaliphila]MCJ8500833.1 condensation domain-containing protein [Desulfatitalea alkaliphila]